MYQQVDAAKGARLHTHCLSDLNNTNITLYYNLITVLPFLLLNTKGILFLIAIIKTKLHGASLSSANGSSFDLFS